MSSVRNQSDPAFPVFTANRLAIQEDRSESYKLVESGFTPFYSSYYEPSGYGGEEYYYHRPRRADNYYGIRQEYLRSYTFTREEPTPEKEKETEKVKESSLKKFKAVVWAVLCLKFRYSQTKMVREKTSSRSSRFIHRSTDYISESCRKIAVPSCVRLSSLEVA